MLTRENNELTCRVGPDTAMGKALRRYWLPFFANLGLPSPDCDPFPLEILGENSSRSATRTRGCKWTSDQAPHL
jgi:hypothetical protein